MLKAATARGEAIFLALRTREGVVVARFSDRFGAAPRAFFGAEIERLGEEGLLVEDSSGDLRLTPRGLLLADLACQPFVEEPLGPGVH